MKSKILQFIILILLLAARPASAAMPANPSYVSQNGSGTACTIGSPCSLGYANANVAAGDTVYLKGTLGTYSVTTSYTGAIQPTNSGTVSSPITFSAAPGETPVCDGGGSTATAFLLQGKSYIRITGITF
jgi:hypothetical protein